MKQTNPSPYGFSGTGWQSLGELKVQGDADLDRAVRAWLEGSLSQLDLHADLLARIHRSACDATARALQFNGVTRRFEHVHLLLFAPPAPAVREQAWGFFRLEKLEETTDPQSLPDHSIELYLYLEKKADAKQADSISRPHAR